jgi:hypothetical protein
MSGAVERPWQEGADTGKMGSAHQMKTAPDAFSAS